MNGHHFTVNLFNVKVFKRTPQSDQISAKILLSQLSAEIAWASKGREAAMKVCPYCSAQNHDQATVCHYCRNDLTSGATIPPAPAENQERTQPLQLNKQRSQPDPPPYGGEPSDTQPMHGPRQGGATSYQSPYRANPDPQQSSQNAQTPTGQPYYGQVPPAHSQYPPYAPPSAQQSRRSPLWAVVIVSLGLVLLCIGGFAIWTISRAASGEVGWLDNRSATEQPGGMTDPTAAPVVPIPFDTPTPWPTFTSPPVDTAVPPADTPIPAATEDPAITRLLSPQCSAALERLETLSGQITEQPTAPLNADWRRDLSDAIANMRTYCGTVDNASPVPGILEEAQRNLALASTEFDQATALFNEGIETFSPGKLLEAARHIGKASEHLRIALAEIRKIGQ